MIRNVRPQVQQEIELAISMLNGFSFDGHFFSPMPRAPLQL